MTINKTYSWVLIICGIVGLLAASQLMIDTAKIAQNPNIDLPCNLSPFVSCTSINSSSQSRVFGFPNPIMGVAGFSVIITVGVLLLFGAEPNRRFWRLFTIGITLAIIFIHWLIFQSIYIIGNLCLYCMVTWVAIWPIFLYSVKNLSTLASPAGRFPFFNKNSMAILVGWYLLIILLILVRFREYFLN